MPAPSCPSTIGLGRVHSPLTTCRSVPQTPMAFMPHQHLARPRLPHLDLGQLERLPGAGKSAARVLTPPIADTSSSRVFTVDRF